MYDHLCNQILFLLLNFVSKHLFLFLPKVSVLSFSIGFFAYIVESGSQGFSLYNPFVLLSAAIQSPSFINIPSLF